MRIDPHIGRRALLHRRLLQRLAQTLVSSCCAGAVLVLAWASASTLLVFYALWAAIGVVWRRCCTSPPLPSLLSGSIASACAR